MFVQFTRKNAHQSPRFHVDEAGVIVGARSLAAVLRTGAT